MHFSTLVSGLLLAASTFAAPTTLEARNDGPVAPVCPVAKPAYLGKVKRQFATDRIVPDLIERINPKVRVNVDYNGKQVLLGVSVDLLLCVS